MNLKAFIMAGIMMTTAASFAVPPAVSGVSARQRYPWNGKVDVDVSFEGPAEKAYRIELSALDRDGGTNLPVATVWRVGANGCCDDDGICWDGGARSEEM